METLKRNFRTTFCFKIPELTVLRDSFSFSKAVIKEGEIVRFSSTSGALSVGLGVGSGGFLCSNANA